MKLSYIALTALGLSIGGATAGAAATYLNETNTTVALGASMPADPFQNGTTAGNLEHILDAPTATTNEVHDSPATHVWYFSTTTPLELDFTFDQEYDLTQFHFWNYFTESFSVDQIDFRMYDSTNALISTLSLFPGEGTNLGGELIQPEAFAFAFANVKSINVLMSGTNGHVDFNNMGWTGTASIGAIPLPATGLMLLGGFAALGFMRRKRRAS